MSLPEFLDMIVKKLLGKTIQLLPLLHFVSHLSLTKIVTFNTESKKIFVSTLLKKTRCSHQTFSAVVVIVGWCVCMHMNPQRHVFVK